MVEKHDVLCSETTLATIKFQVDFLESLQHHMYVLKMAFSSFIVYVEVMYKHLQEFFTHLLEYFNH
jgi:hypothetical protein